MQLCALRVLSIVIDRLLFAMIAAVDTDYPALRVPRAMGCQ